MNINDYINNRNLNLSTLVEAAKAKTVKKLVNRCKSKTKLDPALKVITAISALSPEELTILRESLKDV